MITDGFDRRTIANMEVALERACLLLPTGGEKHRARRVIAGKIIECASRGADGRACGQDRFCRATDKEVH